MNSSRPGADPKGPQQGGTQPIGGTHRYTLAQNMEIKGKFKQMMVIYLSGLGTNVCCYT